MKSPAPIINRIRPIFSGLLLLLCFPAGVMAQENWLQWGGPARNFIVKSKGLANAWPEKGPRQLWTRELGEGHSAIIAEGEMLYTMYSKGEQEYAIAVMASTGKTV